MITIKNYQDQKNAVNWNKMPKSVQDTRSDIEDMMEFYDEDAELKELVDIFLKQINDNSKPVGEIIVGKLPKNDFVEPKAKTRNPERAKVDNLTELKKWLSENIGSKLYLESDYSGPFPKKFKEERVIEKVQSDKFATKRPSGELAWMDFDIAKKWTFSNRALLYRDENVVLVFHYEKPDDFGDKKDLISKSPLVIYKEGKFLTKKTLQSEYSFTENENLAYTWAQSEIMVAEKIAKGYDGLVIDMKEANRITKLMKASEANREKTYPTKKKETLQDAFSRR